VIAALAIGLLVFFFVLRPGAPHPSARPNLLLVTIDTLRADHLGFAGYPRDTSPSLDRLAHEGVWLPRYYSQSATTGAAHASLFTSLPPSETGVTANSQPFPAGMASLMSVLRGDGYVTAAFVSSVVLGRKSKLQDQFDHFDDDLTTIEPNRNTRFERPADETVRAALAFLADVPTNRPFFLWIHLIDPHGPYDAPVDRDRYVGDAYYEHSAVDLPIGDSDWAPGTIPRYQVLDGRSDARFYVARYDAEVRYADAALGKLFDALQKQRLDDRTLIAVTADHGETLDEAGHKHYFTHGAITYDEVTRVPLVVREPAGSSRLAAVDRRRLYSSLDLAPTLLDLLGVASPEGFRGRSMLDQTRSPDAPVSSLGSYGTERLEKETGTQFSVRRGSMHYIVNTKDGTEELYDLALDPTETKNLIAAPPVDVATFRADVTEAVGARRAVAAGRAVGDDHAAALRALGYVE